MQAFNRFTYQLSLPLIIRYLLPLIPPFQPYPESGRLQCPSDGMKCDLCGVFCPFDTFDLRVYYS